MMVWRTLVSKLGIGKALDPVILKTPYKSFTMQLAEQ